MVVVVCITSYFRITYNISVLEDKFTDVFSLMKEFIKCYMKC